MRNMVLSVIVLAVATGIAPAQSGVWAHKLFTFKGGAEALVHNFGSVPRGTILYHQFPIYNPWAVPIDVHVSEIGCSCVTAKLSKTTLQPRESAYLETTMDTARRTKPGPATINVLISVGPQYVDTTMVRVSANIRADVVFNPGQINFGMVSRGQAPTQSVDVEYAGVLDWQVSEVVKNDGPFEVALEPWYRKPGRIGYRVRVTLKADAPPGSLKQELQLKTNDPASPLVPLLVEASIQETLAVKPNPLEVEGSHVGDTVNKNVVVSGNQVFHITGIEGAGEDLIVNLLTSEGKTQIINLKWQLKNPGLAQQQIRIKTDLQSAPLILTVKANVLP